jgi:hypothetical protein
MEPVVRRGIPVVVVFVVIGVKEVEVIEERFAPYFEGMGCSKICV